MNYFSDLTVKMVTRRTFFQYNHRPFTSPEYSIEYIKSGVVKLHIDSETVRLEAPVVFWLGPAHRRYQYETVRELTVPYEHLWIDFSGERGKRIYDSLYGIFRNGFITLPEPRPVNDVFNEILRDFRTDKRKNHPAIVLNIEKLVYLLFKAVEKTPPRNEDRYRIMSVAEKIRVDPAGTFDLRKIASEREISRAYFRELFREKLGQPFHDYILFQRVTLAAEMIRTNRLRIKEIADLCGFQELSSFSRTFKHYFGCSPRNYLRTRQRNAEPEDILPGQAAGKTGRTRKKTIP